MLSFALQTNAQVPLTANVVDQLGDSAQAESISWSVADESVASIDSTSGISVNLIAHAEGSTTVAVNVGSLTTILHVTVAPVVASAVSIEIGAPVAKAVALPVAETPTEAHHEAELHAEAAHPVEHVHEPAPAEPAPHAEETHSAQSHPAETHPAEVHTEEIHAGEETGREAAEPAAPPAPAEATAHDNQASAAA